MKTLPINTSALLASKPGNGFDERDDDNGPQFASLMTPHASAATPPRPRTADSGNDGSANAERPRQDSAPSRDTASAATQRRDDNAAGHGHDQQRDDDGGNEPSRPGERQRAQASSDKSKPAAGNGEDKPADAHEGAGKDTHAADAAWPPAGLGGLGLALQAGAQPNTPAAGQPGALPQGIAGSLGGAARGALLPGMTPAADTSAAGAANAHGPQPGQPGALPSFATALAHQPTALPIDAGAMLAAATPAKGEQAGIGEIKAPDASGLALQPGGHLGATSHVGDSKVFDGSPTPTPHLHGDNFDDELGARMSWLADQKIGHAHIKISPNDLGPVEVRLQLDGDKVNASFVSAHAEVRQALEHSLPRLRDLLGAQGFQLAHADVGQQHQGQNHNARGEATAIDGIAGDDIGTVGIPAAVLRQRGLLDAYA